MTGQLVLGTMFYGTRIDERRSFELLDAFVDLGGTWIDTADCYAFWAHPSQVGGQSEAVIGRWLGARPGTRDRVRISTKVGHQPTIPGRWPESAEGLSADAISSAVAGSLSRLGVNRVDLLWSHLDDRMVPLVEQVDAFGELVTDGQVQQIGASNHPAWRVERARSLAAARGVPPYTAIQLRRSYLQPRPGAELPDAGHMLASPEHLDHAVAEDLAVWGYTPLLNGAYVRADRPLPEVYDHPGTTHRLATLTEVAQRTGATRNQIVLAWLLAGTPPVSPIVGVSTLQQLTEAMTARDVQFTEELRAVLDEPA